MTDKKINSSQINDSDESQIEIDQDADEEAVLVEEEETHKVVAPGKADNNNTSPAIRDGQSASGHAPDPEVDDNVDDLGEEAGVQYEANEELGIDHKYQVETEVEPPTEDTPS